MSKQIKVIDLFAGPGGLGEGFSSYIDERTKEHPFRIALSIEKETSAHATLTLRAFYRQFAAGEAPGEYYRFLAGELGKTPDDYLYKLAKYKKQIDLAHQEARRLTLGEDNSAIDQALEKALRKGEECILIGGPPCQAYSLVGRARRRGISNYVAEEDGRNFLYREYLRILRKCRPMIFVMENVKGILSAKVEGDLVFKRIIEDLSDPWNGTRHQGPKYRVVSMVVPPNKPTIDPHDYIIRMENFGIPQARHRVILLGIRDDICVEGKSWLLEKRKSLPAQKIIGDLPLLRSGLSKARPSETWISVVQDIQKIIAEVKSHDLYGGRKVASAMEAAVKAALEIPDDRGSNFSPVGQRHSLHKHMGPRLRDWYRDSQAPHLVCNHETRGHISGDLHRYLFGAAWSSVAEREGWERPFPKPENYPRSLRPKHANFTSGDFADRFRVQAAERVATTVTSHISKDGHYFIHYDPSQCRSLTVREAARIQTFPDNYFFVGNRTQQYVQVGNAVPPLLAVEIAAIAAGILQER